MKKKTSIIAAASLAAAIALNGCSNPAAPEPGNVTTPDDMTPWVEMRVPDGWLPAIEVYVKKQIVVEGNGREWVDVGWRVLYTPTGTILDGSTLYSLPIDDSTVVGSLHGDDGRLQAVDGARLCGDRGGMGSYDGPNGVALSVGFGGDMWGGCRPVGSGMAKGYEPEL